MKPIRRVVVVPAALLFALAGCSPAEPSPTPVDSPTATCTPLFGGDPYACDQEEFVDLTTEQARHDAAAAQYAEVLWQVEDLLAAKEPISEPVASLMTGQYLDDTTASLASYASGDVTFSGHRIIEWSRPAELSNLGSDLAIEVCSSPGDFTASRDGQVSDPIYLREYVFFETTDGQLRVSSSKNGEAESC